MQGELFVGQVVTDIRRQDKVSNSDLVTRSKFPTMALYALLNQLVVHSCFGDEGLDEWCFIGIRACKCESRDSVELVSKLVHDRVN